MLNIRRVSAQYQESTKYQESDCSISGEAMLNIVKTEPSKITHPHGVPHCSIYTVDDDDP